MITIHKIRLHLDQIIEYLIPFEQFYNCHMVNFLTDKHWYKFIPENIRKSLKTKNDIERAINDIWWNRNENTEYQDLLNFIKKSEKYYLENLDIVTSLESILSNFNCDNQIQTNNETVSIKEFMNEKKRHEVCTVILLLFLLKKKIKKN